MKEVCLIVLVFLPQILSLSLHYNRTTKTYNDLLVSISPDIPESRSTEIISNIKSWITQGSRVLYSTSSGWAHLHTVYILLPTSWSSVPDTWPAQSVHSEAEVRVEPSSPLYGDTPFTLQTGDCGEQGEFIQVSENFLTSQVPDPASVFGPPGQVFVYEWSRLRYGVFSEHGYPGDPLYPMFYHKQIWTPSGPENAVKPNLCTNAEPEGTEETLTGEECETDPVSGLPGHDCIFSATSTPGLTSSIMALPYLAGTKHWCDNTEEMVHDDELPTKHNTMCAGQSVFQVVAKHQDFEGFQPDVDEEADTTPDFTLLRPEEAAGSFVFVLDNSGSMYGNDTTRSLRMKQGVERFMLVDVDLTKQFSVGVVEFSKGATILEEVVVVDNENVRQGIIDSVNGLTEGGGTCLGFGIYRGLEALKKSGLDHGGSAIFLTDGQQSCKDDNSTIQEAIDTVVQQNVRFCTIAFGAKADQNLEILAARTGGAAFFVPDNNGPADVNNALSSCLEFLPSVETGQKDAIILQETFNNNNSIRVELNIDRFAGRDLTIQIDYEKVKNATVTISINNTVRDIHGTSVENFQYANVSFGNYFITVEGASISYLTVLARSKSPPGILPITASCWTNLGQKTLTLSGPEPDKLVLYSQVTEGLSPVLGAVTEAVVTSDSTQSVTVALTDDGVAPDNIKNDGIYSGYFTEFHRNEDESRHQVTCRVRGDDSTRVLNVTAAHRAFPSRPSSTTPICCGSSAVPPDTPVSPTGVFTRSKSGGAVKFGKVNETVIYPPGPVRDLTLDNISSNNLTFSLSFTSPGANLNKGLIKSFRIFYSTNKTLLDHLDTTSSLPSITTEDCHCDLQPQPPGSKVDLTLRFETFSCDEQTFFRVLLLNDANKISLSNTKGIFLPNFPPGIISDLSLGNIQENEETFDLHFTSPGADYNMGTISEYKIFYSDDENMLSDLKINSSVPSVELNNLACNCSLDPQPPRTLINLTLDMTTLPRNQMTFFRVLVQDAGGKTSLSHNPVGFFIPNYPLGLTWGIAVAIFLGSMGATFLVFGAVFWHKWYYKW